MKILLVIFSLICLSRAGEDGRIAGGNIADRGQFPYHVYIEILIPNYIRVCGGAYINFNWVLTAAHCVYDSTDILVYFGKVNSVEGPFSKFQHILGRDHVNIHPQFNVPHLYANDLALIFLPNGHPTDMLDPYMTPVKLPSPSDSPFDSRLGIATGFGRYSDGGDGVFSINLRYVAKRVLSLADCAFAHPLFFYDDKFCTETSLGSTCMGDEGAPYVINMGDGREILAGIGSFGLQECTRGTPPIFTNIAYHLDWIYEHLEREPPTVPVPPPGDGCNCTCNCYTCPALPETTTANPPTESARAFWQK